MIARLEKFLPGCGEYIRSRRDLPRDLLAQVLLISALQQASARGKLVATAIILKRTRPDVKSLSHWEMRWLFQLSLSVGSAISLHFSKRNDKKKELCASGAANQGPAIPHESVTRRCALLSCGKLIEGRQASAKFCGPTCARRHYHALASYDRSCIVCGTGFKSQQSQARCCSEACQLAIKRQSAAKMHAARPRKWASSRDKWAHQNYLRRALTSDHRAEVFDSREVFDRDGWVCGICRDPVDPVITWPDPRSASLDHILPVARGGPHTRANCQCSHLGCNARKGPALAEARS